MWKELVVRSRGAWRRISRYPCDHRPQLWSPRGFRGYTYGPSHILPYGCSDDLLYASLQCLHNLTPVHLRRRRRLS
eukprot:5338315-Amphidinium_carterae.1